MPPRGQRRALGRELRRVCAGGHSGGAAHADRRGGRGVGSLGRSAGRASGSAGGPTGPARLRDPRAAGRRPDRAPRGDARRPRAAHAGVRLRARARARSRSHEARRGGLPLAHAQPDRGGALVALGRGRRHSLQGRGLRLDARSGPAPAGLGRPLGAPERERSPRARGSVPASPGARSDRLPVRPRRQPIRRFGSTRRSGWSTCSTTARSSSERWRRSSSHGTRWPGRTATAWRRAPCRARGSRRRVCNRLVRSVSSSRRSTSRSPRRRSWRVRRRRSGSPFTVATSRRSSCRS